MSVCTGAFQLGKAGLLEGLKATTHHEFWDDFAKQYPKVNLERGVRFVDNGHIATAGGLTSGIDLALHVVARYYGEEVAAATAKYMEYASERWKTGAA
jgi:transcriptional regulator GlxA family with amidase domain